MKPRPAGAERTTRAVVPADRSPVTSRVKGFVLFLATPCGLPVSSGLEGPRAAAVRLSQHR